MDWLNQGSARQASAHGHRAESEIVSGPAKSFTQFARSHRCNSRARSIRRMRWAWWILLHAGSHAAVGRGGLVALKKVQKDLLRAIELEEQAHPELHPYYAIRKIAMDTSSTGPSLSLRLEAWSLLLKTRLPSLTSSKNSIEGAVEHRPAPIGRMAILEALASAPPELRNAILSGQKLLSSGNTEEEI